MNGNWRKWMTLYCIILGSSLPKKFWQLIQGMHFKTLLMMRIGVLGHDNVL
jgi:hypothetical protein